MVLRISRYPRDQDVKILNKFQAEKFWIPRIGIGIWKSPKPKLVCTWKPTCKLFALMSTSVTVFYLSLMDRKNTVYLEHFSFQKTLDYRNILWEVILVISRE